MNTKVLSSKIVYPSSGFSLIEVVLALSIVSVGLITIMGLFPQGLNSAKNAADDSLCTMVAQDSIASRRIEIQNGGTIGVVGTSARFFTANGQETNQAVGAMYNCQITATVVPGVPNLEETQVQIFWPWYSTSLNIKNPAPPNTNTFITEITKY